MPSQTRLEKTVMVWREACEGVLGRGGAGEPTQYDIRPRSAIVAKGAALSEVIGMDVDELYCGTRGCLMKAA